MTHKAPSRFPAILIGGPPQAGKSVLSYSLKEALKNAGVQCYLLRAAPDGEGDWSQEANRTLAERLRRKGSFTHDWIKFMCHDIAYRPLPFLVDVGGRPKPWDEAIFDQCTHAILLTKDPESRLFWQKIVAKYNLILIADLTSQLSGPTVLSAEHPILEGSITKLNRGRIADGLIFETLLARVKALFHYDEEELFRTHEVQAPVDLVVDIARLYRRLNPDQPGTTWQPLDLLKVLEDLPRDTPLALYGIGPAWLYAAVACHIAPNSFYQFDARRGWVKPASLITATDGKSPLAVTTRDAETFLYLHLDILQDYLDFADEITVALPPASTKKGIILSGKLPNWLYTGLVLFYQQAPWVAIYYPHSNQGVIVSVDEHNPGGWVAGQVVDLAGYEALISLGSG